jgi:hypothetical protein
MRFGIMAKGGEGNKASEIRLPKTWHRCFKLWLGNLLRPQPILEEKYHTKRNVAARLNALRIFIFPCSMENEIPWNAKTS